MKRSGIHLCSMKLELLLNLPISFHEDGTYRTHERVHRIQYTENHWHSLCIRTKRDSPSNDNTYSWKGEVQIWEKIGKYVKFCTLDIYKFCSSRLWWGERRILLGTTCRPHILFAFGSFFFINLIRWKNHSKWGPEFPTLKFLGFLEWYIEILFKKIVSSSSFMKAEALTA